MTNYAVKSWVQVCTMSLCLTSFAGLAVAQPTEPEAATCEADTDCELGEICGDGACAAACEGRELQSIYFDFDSAEIIQTEENKIEAIAVCLRAWRDSRVRIEGHWSVYDSPSEEEHPEISTAEYGLAGGERRAASVRRVLERMGIDPARVDTMSYGIDWSNCETNDANCQLLNRRADVVWIEDEPAEEATEE